MGWFPLPSSLCTTRVEYVAAAAATTSAVAAAAVVVTLLLQLLCYLPFGMGPNLVRAQKL